MSTITGGCHCGAIRYEVEGEAIVHALCHCRDCRLHAGAPVVGWTMYPESAVKVTKGEPKVYRSSEHGRRHFCGACGTGLFYVNADILPGIIDIQSATYDPAGHFKFLRVWSVKFLHPARQDMMIVSLTLFPGQGLQRPL